MMESHSKRCKNGCKFYIDGGGWVNGQCLAVTAGEFCKHGNYYNGSMSSQIMLFIERAGCGSYEVKE